MSSYCSSAGRRILPALNDTLVLSHNSAITPVRSLSTSSLLRDPVRPSDDLKKAEAKQKPSEEKMPGPTAAEKKQADKATEQAKKDAQTDPKEAEAKYGSADEKQINATKDGKKGAQ